MTDDSQPPAPQRRAVVAGASGFVGRSLVPALAAEGYAVRAMTRHPERYHSPADDVVAVGADVADEESVYHALRGCDVAYYLVHSLDHRDFATRDATGAENFAAAAARAGVQRIVYLGGLGDESTDLSPHLRSRREVEGLLGATDVPLTSLRAGIVIGNAGASWEIIRNVVEKVPVLTVPRWALTRTQPIALSDTVRYLVGVVAGDLLGDGSTRTFDIGGAEVLRYVDMLTRVSALEGRLSLVVPVPVPAAFGGLQLATLIAAQALPLITGVDARTIRSLLESMRNEVVVRDDSIRRVVDFEPMDYDGACAEALADGARQRRKAKGT